MSRNCLIWSIYYNLLYLIVIDIVIIHYYHQIFTLNKGLSYFLETFRSITIYIPGNNLLFMVIFQTGSRKYLVLLDSNLFLKQMPLSIQICVRRGGYSLTHGARTPPVVHPGMTIWGVKGGSTFPIFSG